MLTLIAARDRNGAIGRGNDIPWRAPADLAHFQRETRGAAVIMGRRTWDSLPVRPLRGRLNLVVSRDPSAAEHVLATPEAAVEHAYRAGYRQVYGIGGAAIYQALLPLADRMLITDVDLEVADADTFFPAFDPTDWDSRETAVLGVEAPRCTLFTYLRRR